MQAHGASVRVLALEVSEKAAKKRAAGRLINAMTGDIYHSEFLPPPSDVDIVQREMDKDAAAFSKRLDVFKHQLRRVLPCLPPVLKVLGTQVGLCLNQES